MAIYPKKDSASIFRSVENNHRRFSSQISRPFSTVADTFVFAGRSFAVVVKT